MRKSQKRARSAFVLVFALVTVVTVATIAACSSKPAQPSSNDGQNTQTVTPTPEPTSTPAEPTQTAEVDVKLYFTRGETIGVAGRRAVFAAGETVGTPAFYARVISLLLGGPSAEEKEFGLSTAIPSGTELYQPMTSTGSGSPGVEVSGDTATVDLGSRFQSGGGSLSMQLRAAEVVCTLTQFDAIKRVSFRIDGKHVDALGGEGVKVGPTVTRADFENVLPAILVEQPVPGESIKSPVTISGSANVFEAQFQVQVTDPEGLILVTKSVLASSGTGTRGTFKVSVPFKTTRTGLGEIIAFDRSEKDGSRIDIVEIPVHMTK
jgi:spore germination protein GerM